MRKIICFIWIFLLCPVQLYPQSDQAIVYFEDLNFNSAFEETAFYKLQNNSEDLLRLFAAIDPDVTENIYLEFQQDLDHELERLRTRKFLRSKNDKKVKLLYGYVNTQVLTRYQEKILFPHLFVNGTFNCLTASAFYGFLMDSLNIDYEFRETNNHVHPVAFPEDLQIKIETTDRLSGIKYYDTNLKNQFVDYLLNNKIISREEYYSKSIEKLFNEYFLPESSIGMKELAGLHYMNDALYKFDADQLNEAFEQIKKAYFIYPSEKMLTIFQFILSNVLALSRFSDVKDAMYFVYLSRLPSERISPEEIASGFSVITDEILFNSQRTEYYDELFTCMDNKMREGEIKDIISFQYYFYRGKSFVAQYMFNNALDFYVKAYHFNPYNLELQTSLIAILSTTLKNTPGNNIVEKIESYATNMPVLAENGMFKSLQLKACLLVIQQYFDLEKPEQALTYLRKFELLYSDNSGLVLDYDLVGDAYSAAAVYYFKNYDKEKAIYFLRRGLKIAPDHFELLYRLNSIDE